MVMYLGLARSLLIAAAVLALTVLAAEAQPAAKVYRIGILEGVEPSVAPEHLDALRAGLRELGYVEGQNLVVEQRATAGRPERLPDLAAELVRLNVDVIVTRGTPAVIAAKHATRTIPIVMAVSGDPVAEGVVRSNTRPGGNVTGLHLMVPPELGGQRLRLLKEAVPATSRVGMVWNPADIQSPLLARDTERTARAMGIELTSLELPRAWPTRAAKAFDEVFEAAMMRQVDAIIAVEDYVTFGARTHLVGFAAMSRLPAIYGLREFVEAGGLMSYGADRRDLFRRSATFIHKILSGARPGDLPVEPPTKFELAVNLRTAKALGITIPAALLQRADYIVQ